MNPEQSLLELIVNRNMDNVLGDRSETNSKVGASLSEALTVAREQELHLKSMQQEDAKLKNQLIKNDKAELDIELSKAKAKAQGLVQDLPQDPVKAEQIAGTMSRVKWPSEGTYVRDQLLQKDTNFSKGLIAAFDERLNQLKATGERKTDSATQEQDKWLRDELINTLKRVDNEKSLSLSPLGQIGGVFGGILDIVSGPLDLGTELFGGTVGPAQKAELITRALSVTSPLLRAEMFESLGRDRLEASAERRLSSRGLGNLRTNIGSSADQEGANEIIATAIDIRKYLEDTVPNSFGSDAKTGIGQAFDAYDTVTALKDQLKEAVSEEEVIALTRKIAQADTVMRASIQQYLANGGSPESIKEEIVTAIDKINEGFQKPLQFSGDIRATQFQARQKAVAKEYTSKLNDLYRAIFEDIQFDVEAVKPIIQQKKETALDEEVRAEEARLGRKFSEKDFKAMREIMRERSSRGPTFGPK